MMQAADVGLQVAPKTLFSSLTKCWNCSVMGVTFAMGVSLLARMASASQAKANLHPLAFYTIKVTSPRWYLWRNAGSHLCPENQDPGSPALPICQIFAKQYDQTQSFPAPPNQ